MKTLVVKWKKNINEATEGLGQETQRIEAVMMSRKPSTSDIIHVVKTFPRLKKIYVSDSYLEQMGKALPELLAIFGIELKTKPIDKRTRKPVGWGLRTDTKGKIIDFEEGK